jgi:hypothetical protein
MTDLQAFSLVLSLLYIFLTYIVNRGLPQPVNIIFILYSMIFFITHHLQGVWISFHFEREILKGFFYKGDSYSYLDDQIILAAMILNFGFFLLVLMPVLISKKHLSIVAAKKKSYSNNLVVKKPYVFYLIFLIIFSLILTKIGFYNLIFRPGYNFTSGLATYLVLLYIIQFYLLARINCRSIAGFDYLAFLGVGFILLFTSRASLIIFILAIFVTLYSSRRFIKWIHFFYLSMAVWLIMVVYGIYRHIVTSKLQNLDLNIDSVSFLTNLTRQFDWIMYANIEGFSGSAATLNEVLLGTATYDYGLSIILSIFKVVPSFIYNIYGIDYLSIFKEYIYTGSATIPGIVESSILQYGLFGVLIYGLGTGILIVIFGKRLIINFNLSYIVVAITLIYSIRGGISGMIILGVSYFIMLILFHFINRLRL